MLAGLRREARLVPTDEERDKLRGWSGWGPLAPMFAGSDKTWLGIADEVAGLLPVEELNEGRDATFNAFYTPPAVAASMWRILQRLGFAGGRVLEPGCGSGVFLGTAPDGVVVTGVEKDTVSAAIAQLLHPTHTVVHGAFEQVRMSDGFSAAIGNVPFGDVPVHDPLAPVHVRRSLHNYCIWRAVKELAPGGVAVLITSRHTMDAHGYGALAREEIGELADLVGAFRLPNGALGGGTDVVADVLVLRRLDYGDDERRGEAWLDTADAGLGDDIRVNGYFMNTPSAVLGELRAGSTGRYGLELCVDAPEGDVAELLAVEAEALAGAAAGADLLHTAGAGSVEAGLRLTDLDAKGWYEGSYHLVDGTLWKVREGRRSRVGDPRRELLAMVGLRDKAQALIDAEADHDRPDAALEPLRTAVAEAYRAYVDRFGFLNRGTLVRGKPDPETGEERWVRRVPDLGGFRSDPGLQLVLALERFDDDTEVGEPAPLLSARQNRRVVRPERTDDAEEALAWCLDRTGGRVDVGYIGRLLGGVPADEVPGLLGDELFRDPATQAWQTRSEYLSGNVRHKLATAQTAALVYPEYERNVKALKAVQPKWLGPADITVNMNAPWLPLDDVRRFVRDLLGGWCELTRLDATGQWELKIGEDWRDSPEARVQWGTSDKDAYTLIASALNGKIPIVKVAVDLPGGETVEVKDPERTLLATEKQQAIRARFCEWVWECPERTIRLVKRYNELYNSVVARTFDGSGVTIDGLAPWFTPYAHQMDYVARAMSTRRGLCGHPVGAGKTYTMAMTAAKLKQLGLIRKALVTVPNHLLDQVAREIMQLLPGLRVLVTPSETTAAVRRSFNARCATGDWDVVMVPHSQFDVIPVHPDTEADYISDQVFRLEESIRQACPSGRLEGRMIKQVAKQAARLRTRIRDLRARAHGDVGVTFEQLGIDYVIVDEAHYYKNLAMPCRTDGFTINPSKRATHLDMLLRWLSGRGDGPVASLFTGTPISNSMLEIYIMLHYLMPDDMEAVGLGTADQWAAAYTQFVTTVDVTMDGGNFAIKTRPATFVNAPELRMQLSQVADVRTAEQLGLKRPLSHLEVVVSQPTRVQQMISKWIVKRASQVEGKRFFAKGEDNMLAICGDGRRAATDAFLLDFRDDEEGKLHAVAARMLKMWREHPDKLQIGFCDVGTPNEKAGSQTYGRLRRMLVDGGMPVGRIRFAHDAKNRQQTIQLHKECNAGSVSVILGSTDKLGVGTNIQKLVIAIHHIDAPWRPADVEQRDGRGLRPGNVNPIVYIFRYVTERTFDAYLWQMLTRKIRFITQVVSGRLDRTVEDIGVDNVDSYAGIQAMATGQPLLKERKDLTAQVKRLTLLRREHDMNRRGLEYEIDTKRQQIEGVQAQALMWQALADTAVPLTDDDRAALAEHMADFAGWRRDRCITAGGWRVAFGEWRNTFGRKTTREPVMYLHTDHGVYEERIYTSFDEDKLAELFATLAERAKTRPEFMRKRAEQLRAEIANAEALTAKPFEEANRLASVLARLDQIEAELQEAAQAAGGDTGGEEELFVEELELYRINPPDPEEIADNGDAPIGDGWLEQFTADLKAWVELETRMNALFGPASES